MERNVFIDITTNNKPKKLKEVKVSFLSFVDPQELNNYRRAIDKCGSDVIDSEFPELNAIGNWVVKDISDADTPKDKREIETSFFAFARPDALVEFKQAIQKCGSDVIADNFPELSDVGCFDIREVSKKLSKDNDVSR